MANEQGVLHTRKHTHAHMYAVPQTGKIQQRVVPNTIIIIMASGGFSIHTAAGMGIKLLLT